MTTETETPDPELAELRSRRVAQLLTQAARSTPPAASGPAAHPVPLTLASFDGTLRDHSQIVVDFWAPWCGPCRTLGPIVDRLARELAPKVLFGQVNADEEPELAQRWRVQGIPTLLFFHQGRLVDRVMGAMPYPGLRARVLGVFTAAADIASEVPP